MLTDSLQWANAVSALPSSLSPAALFGTALVPFHSSGISYYPFQCIRMMWSICGPYMSFFTRSKEIIVQLHEKVTAVSDIEVAGLQGLDSIQFSLCTQCRDIIREVYGSICSISILHFLLDCCMYQYTQIRLQDGSAVLFHRFRDHMLHSDTLEVCDWA